MAIESVEQCEEEEEGRKVCLGEEDEKEDEKENAEAVPMMMKVVVHKATMM